MKPAPPGGVVGATQPVGEADCLGKLAGYALGGKRPDLTECGKSLSSKSVAGRVARCVALRNGLQVIHANFQFTDTKRQFCAPSLDDGL